MTNMMNALVAKTAHNHPTLMKMPVPQINDQQVLIEVVAASINPVDSLYKMMDKGMKMKVKYPFILGNDFSGRIVEIGQNVSGYQVGDAVYGRIDGTDSGTFAQYLAIKPEFIAPAPKNLTLDQSAGVPLVGLTAYQALFDVLKIEKNQKIFINAGSGGVGSMAIQLAKAKGAFVVTTTSEKNEQLVSDLGSDQVIDYHKRDFSEELKDFDAVFDTHGGDDTAKALKILKPHGRLVTISGPPTSKLANDRHLGMARKLLFTAMSRSIFKQAEAKQIDYQFLLMNPNGQQLKKMTELIEQEQLQPIIDRSFPLSQINAAMDYSALGHNVGKVIIKIK